MALFTLEELAVALGREITDDEEPYYQYLIDSVSVYIESYTGVAFSRHEDETVRYRADGHGIIKLIGPVESVSSMTAVHGTDPFKTYDYYFGPYWDGFDEVYYLPAYAVVDITYTYGLGEVPEDIKKAAIEAVAGRISGSDGAQLDTYIVGDVTEKFKQPWGYENFSQMAQLVLDSYRGVGLSWRL
jgi:hypothetical protein